MVISVSVTLAYAWGNLSSHHYIGTTTPGSHCVVRCVLDEYQVLVCSYISIGLVLKVQLGQSYRYFPIELRNPGLLIEIVENVSTDRYQSCNLFTEKIGTRSRNGALFFYSVRFLFVGDKICVVSTNDCHYFS